MQFTELQELHGSKMSWKQVRKSRNGNLVMFGEKVTGGIDNPGARWPSGWAFAVYVTAIVHPTSGEVLAKTVDEDDWPF